MQVQGVPVRGDLLLFWEQMVESVGPAGMGGCVSAALRLHPNSASYQCHKHASQRMSLLDPPLPAGCTSPGAVLCVRLTVSEV